MIRCAYFWHLAFVGVLLIAFAATNGMAQTADPGNRDTVIKLIRQANKAVQENNRSAALQFFEQADRQPDAVAQLSIFQQEALKWNIAQLYLERSNEMEDEGQILYFANPAGSKNRAAKSTLFIHLCLSSRNVDHRGTRYRRHLDQLAVKGVRDR